MAKSIDQNALVEYARQVREQAYVPYSHYAVGAAVLGKSGRVFAGCNVENASYGLTICAERAAIFKAVSEGEKEFQAFAVVTSNGGTPCGACRQVFLEFSPADAQVIVADTTGRVLHVYTIGELLADGFGPGHLLSK
jgi:cytidine deaminase